MDAAAADRKRIGQQRIGQQRIGQQRIGQQRIGQQRIGQHRIGQQGRCEDSNRTLPGHSLNPDGDEWNQLSTSLPDGSASACGVSRRADVGRRHAGGQSESRADPLDFFDLRDAEWHRLSSPEGKPGDRFASTCPDAPDWGSPDPSLIWVAMTRFSGSGLSVVSLVHCTTVNTTNLRPATHLRCFPCSRNGWSRPSA